VVVRVERDRREGHRSGLRLPGVFPASAAEYRRG